VFKWILKTKQTCSVNRTPLQNDPRRKQNKESGDRETHRTTLIIKPQSNAITVSIKRREFDRRPIQMTCLMCLYHDLHNHVFYIYFFLVKLISVMFPKQSVIMFPVATIWPNQFKTETAYDIDNIKFCWQTLDVPSVSKLF